MLEVEQVREKIHPGRLDLMRLVASSRGFTRCLGLPWTSLVAWPVHGRNQQGTLSGGTKAAAFLAGRGDLLRKESNDSARPSTSLELIWLRMMDAINALL